MSLKVLCLGVLLGISAWGAHAQETPPPLEGTFTIKVYQGQGGGSATDPRVQALAGNPLITGSPLATVTYVGSLDFDIGAADPNTIGAFFATGTSSSITGLDATTAALTMSTAPYAITTVLDIAFNTGGIEDGVISHDDGIGLYVNGTQVTPNSAAAPTVRVSTPFTSPAGSYRLVYVAANGRPQVLIANGTPTLTPDFVDFGCRIDLVQTGVPDPFKFVLPATSSEKFCPGSTGGTLKLACSGTIPDYTGPAVTSTNGVVCRISGSQCGLSGEFVADTESINVTTGGLATLSCEASVGG